MASFARSAGGFLSSFWKWDLLIMSHLESMRKHVFVPVFSSLGLWFVSVSSLLLNEGPLWSTIVLSKCVLHLLMTPDSVSFKASGSSYKRCSKTPKCVLIRPVTRLRKQLNAKMIKVGQSFHLDSDGTNSESTHNKIRHPWGSTLILNVFCTHSSYSKAKQDFPITFTDMSAV